MKTFVPALLFFRASLAAPLLFAAEPPPAPAIPLAALVEQIATSHPELQFYAAEIAVARAGERTAASRPDPEVSLELGRKRVKDSAGAVAGAGTAWTVSVTQTFEWPGRLALRKAIANRQVGLAELGLARFRHALTAQARTLAYGLHAADVEAAAIREVADRFAALKATFLARDPAGITPLLETRVIEASELTLQRRATRAELAVQAALIELNQLRGVAPDTPLRVPPGAPAFHEPPDNAALLAAARENNFDFRLRRLELEQQGFQVQLARHERRPAVSVSPFFSHEKAGDRESVFGLGVSVPLPLGGRTAGTVDTAEARRRQAEAAVLMAQRELEREVLVAAGAFRAQLAESRRWAPESVQKFREAAELADRHYRLGAVSVATYVELQASYLEAVESLLGTEREALAAGLKLQQLTGLDFKPVEFAP